MRTKCRRLGQDLDNTPIEVDVVPFVSKDTSVVTIGSCFALEIERWMIRNNYNVLHEGIAELIWYNTFTILAEFERAAGVWKQEKDDVWELEDGRWQDPYRRCVFADSKDQLWKKIDRIDLVLGDAIRSFDLIIVTLGLTEVWKKRNGRVMCGAPGYRSGGGQRSTFWDTNYDENYQNMEKAVCLLGKINPNAQMVLTVSPVPMFATSRGVDHVVANTASKSILRAVADEITKDCENVHYFHSYERVICEDRTKVFRKDGRHVCKSYVDRIMGEFQRVFVVKEEAK